MMRLFSLLALFGTSAAGLAVLPSCATPPATDGDLYIARDTSAKTYQTNKYISEIGKAMQRVEGFYSQSKFQLKVSVGLAHYMYEKYCYDEMLLDGSLSQVAGALEKGEIIYKISDNFEAAHVIYALFLQQGKWNAAAGPSYRRVYLIITSQRPLAISTSVAKTLDHKDSMSRNCPISYGQMRGRQLGSVMAQAEAGLGAFLVENVVDSYTSTWTSYLKDGQLTDAIVYGAHSTYGMDWDLFQLTSSLFCPSWIATTSTTTVAPPTTAAPTTVTTKLPSTALPTTAIPPRYDEDTIYKCLTSLSECSSDVEEIRAQVADCLNE